MGFPGAVAADEECFSACEFVDVVGADVHDGLYDGSFGGDDEDFVVGVVEGGAYAPGVAYGEGFAAAGGSADDVSSVPGLCGGEDDACEVDVAFDESGDFESGEGGVGGGVFLPELGGFAVE